MSPIKGAGEFSGFYPYLIESAHSGMPLPAHSRPFARLRWLGPHGRYSRDPHRTVWPRRRGVRLVCGIWNDHGRDRLRRLGACVIEGVHPSDKEKAALCGGEALEALACELSDQG